MSTDGTKPPSIAPKRPAGQTGGSGPVPTGARTATQTGPVPTHTGSEPPRRPVTGPVSGPSAPSSTDAGSASTSTGGTPSVTDRLKSAAASVAETTRNVLPHRDEDTTPPRGTASSQGAPRPASSRPSPVAPSPSGPRKVRLAVAKIDPWSVMKLSFLLSVAIGIMIVVAAAVVWFTLDGLAVFSSLNDTIAEITGSETFFDLNEYASFERTISLATMIAVVDVVLLTALSTIGAFLYNIVAALVGGLHLTLTDD